MGIVVITILGSAKMAFAASLHQKTEGGVDLVIVQKWKPDSYSTQAKRLFKKGPIHFLKEAWAALMLRLRPRVRTTLDYFRASTMSAPSVSAPKSVFVDDINSDEVHALLEKLSPEMLVVWGSKVLDMRIIKTAKRAVNLHLGRCPQYRGTLANQLAVLERDREHIGATIHYVAPHVDAGPIIEVVKPDLARSPRDLFRDLNDRAQSAYIDIIARLHRGEELESRPQDETKGKNLRLRDWTPYVRYQVAKELRAWEKAA